MTKRLCSEALQNLTMEGFFKLISHFQTGRSLHTVDWPVYLWSSMLLQYIQEESGKVHPEGKYVVDIDKSIDIAKITPSTRVALRNDSYVLHLVLPSKVDPLVNLMKVEKVPDSTYDMICGLDQQIKRSY